MGTANLGSLTLGSTKNKHPGRIPLNACAPIIISSSLGCHPRATVGLDLLLTSTFPLPRADTDG